MNTVKYRVGMGNFEFEYEGDSEFLKTEALKLLKEISDQIGEIPVVAAVQKEAAIANPDANGAFSQSTDTIASMTGVKTGPDLAMAAAAHLSLVKGQAKFNRKEILDEMQSAVTFYNHNYSGNLSKILTGLTKSRKLNLVSTQTYSLSKPERDRFLGELESE